MAGSKPKRSSFYADLDHLRTHFDALDTERCGFIGYAQLQTLAQQIQGFDESMVSELMEKLDRDRDGKVRSRCRVLAACGLPLGMGAGQRTCKKRGCSWYGSSRRPLVSYTTVSVRFM